MKATVLSSSVLGLIASLTLSTAAYADGFSCEATDQNIKVEVFNQTSAEEGTRNASVMVVSDPSVAYGKQTIARFSSVRKTLINDGATYTALVDLRFADSARKGEDIGETKLGNLQYIVLGVDFSYARPVEEGELVSGEVVLVKRNGDELRYEVSCVRYLKGE